MFVLNIVKIDRSTAQPLAKNKKASARPKHIDLKYHYVKDAFEKGLSVSLHCIALHCMLRIHLYCFDVSSHFEHLTVLLSFVC